jgi:hypothetical protein
MTTTAKTALSHALGLFVYIALVVLVMTNAEELFGNTPKYLGTIAFLSLFALSASVVGGLILGKPLMMYLDNKKKEAVALFLQTIGCFAGLTVLLIIILALTK